jgi:hypothetical protein
MHSLVPQTLHVKDKTLNSSSLPNRSPSFSLSHVGFYKSFFFFLFLFLFSLQVATPTTITNAKTHGTRTNSKMDFIYRFTKPMRSNPKMGKENPEKKCASGRGWRKKNASVKTMKNYWGHWGLVLLEVLSRDTQSESNRLKKKEHVKTVSYILRSLLY